MLKGGEDLMARDEVVKISKTEEGFVWFNSHSCMFVVSGILGY